MFYTNVSQVGNKILHRWIDAEGKRRESFGDVEPELFVHTRKDSKYRGIEGEKLDVINFDNIREAKDFIKEHEDISNFPIYGNQNWWAQFIAQKYPNEIKWDIDKLVVANLDIECKMGQGFPEPSKANQMITAITVEVNDTYMVFGSKEYTKKLPENVTHYHAQNEKDLLFNFLTYWEKLNPDVITGWNVEGFDIPYLINRISNIMGDEYVDYLAPAARKVSRMAVTSREFRGDVYYTLNGVSVLDYMVMYKKFTYKMRERYSLDYIAYVELGERKLDYSEYGNLDDLYEKDYNTYIDYNIRDTHLVMRLDNKLQLLMLVYTLTYMCKIPHKDVFSQVRMWDTLIYNKLLADNVVVPPKSHFSKDEKYKGAVVFDPKTGLHKWVVSFDLDGLYPHLIMQYNISPEMMVSRDTIDNPLMFNVSDLVNATVDTSFLKDANLSMTANKAFFKRDKQGFLPAMMEDLYRQRKDVKRNMLDADSDVELIKGILHDRESKSA